MSICTYGHGKLSDMLTLQLLCNLRSYYRGCRNRDLQEFYDLESRLPYFDQVSRILCAHKRHLLRTWITAGPVQGPIVELGSGIGTFARQLGRWGYPVLAVDIPAAAACAGSACPRPCLWP